MEILVALLVSAVASYVFFLIVWWNLPKLWKNMVTSTIDLLQLLISIRIHGMRYNGKRFSYADVFEASVDSDPKRVQFISVDDDRSFTLAEMDRLANQISWWLISQGVQQRDTVALMMMNRPEYVIFWLACAKIGVTCSLMNSNNTGKTLLHASNLSLQESKVKILMIDSELRDQVSPELEELKANGIKIVFWGDSVTVEAISKCDDFRPSKSLRSTIRERDPLILIFTSGTTGLPKASKISHSRYLLASYPYGILAKLGKQDRIYNAMPLYHASAGMLGVGGAIRYGACMVLRKKFSVRAFASDCVKYQCTSMQYIGELCRYLVAAPHSEFEAKVQLRTAFGNGMRPEVWEKFQRRYNVEHIVEFYASTEGNLGFFNNVDKVGALGFVPRIADIIYPVILVKPDPDDAGVPFVNEAGRCVLCKPNEVGLLIAPIDHKRIDRRFDGYTDGAATSKKVIKNVLKEGDLYFNSGDLLYRDADGFYFWSDRTGDTFRWKGENVSTSEISEIMSARPGIKDVTVYGVEVPGSDGRAGMASIVLNDNVTPETFDWSGLATVLGVNLPAYARPLFFRIQKKLATTSTFKHLKTDLVKESFHLGKVNGDPVYFHSIKDKNIVPLTSARYEELLAGKCQV